MGLFSRQTKDDDSHELLDSAGLPGSQDLNEEFFEPDEPPVALGQGEPRSKPRNLSYGIEDAIGLMRKLPSNNLEVVVSVVKQTLESTNIHVDDIIADAEDKEARLLAKNAQLEREIQSLQNQIAERNQQIAKLLEDHKETVSVRERLQLSNEIAERSRPARKPAAKPQAPDQELATAGEPGSQLPH